MFLNGLETGSGGWRVDVVRIGNAPVKAAFLPGFPLATQVTLDPWDGDHSPHSRPRERESPAQLPKISTGAKALDSRTYREGDWLGNGEDDGSDRGRTDD